MTLPPKRTTLLGWSGSALLLLALSVPLGGCSREGTAPKPGEAGATPPAGTAPEPGAAATAPSGEAQDEAPLPPPAYELELPEGVRSVIDQPFTGDLDQMLKRRLIRAGVTFNRTHYFVDKGVQRGAAYEYLKLFEDKLNEKHRTGNLKALVVFVPLPRDMLLPALASGKVDLVAAQLTVTPERQKLVDFSVPTRDDVSEVVVTGPGAPAIATVADLAGQRLFVRKTSSYYESLLALNQTLAAQGKARVEIEAAPEELEDDDILEMVNAGLVPATVVDDYLAQFWKKVLTNLTVHDAVTVRTGGHLAVAFRKGSPQLAAECNEFIGRFGEGTAYRNVIEKRYLQATTFVKSATAEAERKKLMVQLELFKKYSAQYQLDFLLMAAQGYQESQLDQNARSRVGAIGVMQVMPATGKELNVGDIRQLEPNIHAGVKYIRFMIDRYYKDEPMSEVNKGLFAFASYNAGPGRVRQLRREAKQRGLDPNVWFGNVERIASERIGRETVTYVSNIFKYYVAYRLWMASLERKAATKERLKAN